MIKRRNLWLAGVLGLLLVVVPAVWQRGWATRPWMPSLGWQSAATVVQAASSPSDDSGVPQPQPFDEVVGEMSPLAGLFTLYRDAETGKFYGEIRPDQLNVNFLATITLESGIGAYGIYRGLPMGDFPFYWRRVNNTLQMVIPNVYFRARKGDPVQRSVRRSFSDSVVAALPIESIHPTRKTLLVDFNALLLKDLPAIAFPNDPLFKLETEKSYLDETKNFPLNLEVQFVYGFATLSDSPEMNLAPIPTLPDGRSFNLSVHYSFSQLPTNNGYRPRLADERVGYFLTAYQNLSDLTSRDLFVRYINRWHLEKQNPALPVSPPKQPIVFWLENTIPVEYRQAVREGVLMWNAAFEQIGFKDAIEARQMPDNADWDPADIRYNTIRWINSLDGSFALGPSRVNPLTGQILDADILVDANLLRASQAEFRVLVQPQAQGNLTQRSPWGALSGRSPLANSSRTRNGTMATRLSRAEGEMTLCWAGGQGLQAWSRNPLGAMQIPLAQESKIVRWLGQDDTCYGLGAAGQFAVGRLALSLLQNRLPSSVNMQDYTQQFLRWVIAHEVGHTLGLRHNFRASGMLTPQQLNQPELTRQKGLLASVMDYAPVNLAPQGIPQGDYFSQVIGPYDQWAIAYGYTPSTANTPTAERELLAAIARRAPESELAYGTDEDAWTGTDPLVQRFDLSNDVITYTGWQLDNAQEMWRRLDRRSPAVGENFNQIRLDFDDIFIHYLKNSLFLTQYIGGRSLNRYRGGDAVGRSPIEWVSPSQQRQALAKLEASVLNAQVFDFSPEFLSKLAPSRWMHWGEFPDLQVDYPIHQRIVLLQSWVLGNLLESDRLARLRDVDLQRSRNASAPTGRNARRNTTPDDNQPFTLTELFDSLQTHIWQDVLQPQANQPSSSLQRALQRVYVEQLMAMLRDDGYDAPPEDARSLAWYKLQQLQEAIDKALRDRGGQLDTLTKAHLKRTSSQIAQQLKSARHPRSSLVAIVGE